MARESVKTDFLERGKQTPRRILRNATIVSNDVGPEFVEEQLNIMGLDDTQLDQELR